MCFAQNETVKEIIIDGSTEYHYHDFTEYLCADCASVPTWKVTLTIRTHQKPNEWHFSWNEILDLAPRLERVDNITVEKNS